MSEAGEASLALQRAVFVMLEGNITIGSEEVRVRDAVEPNLPKPYIVIGDAEEDHFDTKDTDGLEAAFAVQIFSEYRGRRELKEIAAQIYNLLHHADLTLDGFQCVLVRFDHANYPLEADGLTRRGELRYVALISREPEFET